MNTNFNEKDFEKRDRIINAAMDEFSSNSFDKASTNNIVKKANVSKGLLYHYFESKQDLYDYLLDFVFKTIGDAIRDNMDFSEGDFFKRVQKVVEIKMEVMASYPKLYDFSTKLLSEVGFERLMEISEKYNLDLLQKIYTENIDVTLFKEGTNLEVAMNIIRWTIEKFGESMIQKGVTKLEEFVDEFNAYTSVLRDSLYK